MWYNVGLVLRNWKHTFMMHIIYEIPYGILGEIVNIPFRAFPIGMLPSRCFERFTAIGTPSHPQDGPFRDA